MVCFAGRQLGSYRAVARIEMPLTVSASFHALSLGSQSGINWRTSSGESIFQSFSKTYALRKTISVR